MKSESLKEWRETERFTEMARIGNLPKHTKISIWVNEKREEREAPHVHIRLSNNDVIRLYIKTLKGMDGRTLESNVMKEFKKWLLSSHRDNAKVTNLEVAIIMWNAQAHAEKIKMSQLSWLK